MDHQGYVNPLLNEIALIVQIVVAMLAYFFNAILIIIVHKNTNKEIGNYKILITYFAVSDIYYNTLHFIVYPIPETFQNAFMMRGHGIYPELLGVGLYSGAYGHAFPILIFHFLYRFLAIKHPHYLQYFPTFLTLLVIATMIINITCFSAFYWFFHPDELSLRILTPVFNGSIPLPVVHTILTAEKHSIALYWTGQTFEGPRWRSFIGVGLVFVSMICTYIIIIVCSYHINKYLKLRMKSARSIQLHRQLFRSLIYQVSPSLTHLLPYLQLVPHTPCSTLYFSFSLSRSIEERFSHSSDFPNSPSGATPRPRGTFLVLMEIAKLEHASVLQ